MNSFSPEDGAFKPRMDMESVQNTNQKTNQNASKKAMFSRGLEIGPESHGSSSTVPSFYHRPLSRMRALARARTDLQKERLRATLIAIFLLLALATQIFIETHVR